MLGRILFTGAAASILSACALLQPFEGKTTQEGYFPAKSVADQDPYWRRFYELEQEIARLKASNARLQQQIAPADSVYTAPAPQPDVKVEDPPLVDNVLDRVRQQADRAIAAIDRAMESLAVSTAPEVRPEVAIETSTPDSAPDIQGNLIRDKSGDVIKQTTYSESRRARYNYSVVYVYPEPQPWNDMWAKLEDANEKDKWRGFNPDKTRYFIYVGAYYNQMDAEQRQEALFTLVGERPDLRERLQNQTIASN